MTEEQLEYKFLILKTLKIISTCKTKEQIIVATRYFNLAQKEMSRNHADMLLMHLFYKQFNLEDDAADGRCPSLEN